MVSTEFVRLPYTEGIKILEEAIAKGKKFEFPVYWGCDLASEHERYLVEEHFQKPVIMTDYPAEIKAFYMKQNEDGKTVQGTDVLFLGGGPPGFPLDFTCPVVLRILSALSAFRLQDSYLL